MSRRAKLLWIGTVILVGAAAISYDLGRVTWWYDFIQPVTDDSWSVALPRGGSIRYTSCSPRMHFFGPSDSEKTLTWTKPDGSSQSYPVSNIGGSYRELEVRVRRDEQAVWFVSPNPHERGIIATLDLQSGEFTAGGTIYDAHGEQNMERSGTPGWAKVNAGRVLAHKRFR